MPDSGRATLAAITGAQPIGPRGAMGPVEWQRPGYEGWRLTNAIDFAAVALPAEPVGDGASWTIAWPKARIESHAGLERLEDGWATEGSVEYGPDPSGKALAVDPDEHLSWQHEARWRSTLPLPMRSRRIRRLDRERDGTALSSFDVSMIRWLRSDEASD